MRFMERNPETVSGDRGSGGMSGGYTVQGGGGSATARLWEPDALEGLVEGEVFGILAPERPEVSAQRGRAIRAFFRSVRAGVPPAAVGRTAHKLRERGNLMGDVASCVMLRLVEEYERRKTETVRRDGTAAVQHARHLEVRFGGSGEPSVRVKVAEEPGARALGHLVGGIYDFFSPVVENGGRDERVWWTASELLHVHYLVWRTQDVLRERWGRDLGDPSESSTGTGSGAGAPSGDEVSAAVAEGVPSDAEAFDEALMDRDGELYLTLAQFLAQDYLRALETGVGWVPDVDLEQLVGVEVGAEKGTLPLLPTRDDHRDTLSAHVFNELRAALAARRFRRDENSPWPVAPLGRTKRIGHAIMRPRETDSGLLDPEQVEHWAAEMHRQRKRLSDLDADVLDALTAAWLYRGPSHPQGLARIDVDEILDLRELGNKTNARGYGRGYHPDQRRRIAEAVAHIENIFLDMGEMEVHRRVNGKVKQVRERTHSRAFVVTDVHESLQPRLDGYAQPVGFTFRPGEVFGHFLTEPGRQVMLQSAQALRYHETQQIWEKRLARELPFHWRVDAHKPLHYLQPLRVHRLLRMVNTDLEGWKPYRIRERLEKALNTLGSDGVIAGWQYDPGTYVDAREISRKRRHGAWLSSGVVVEPPDVVKEDCDRKAEAAQKRIRKRGAALPGKNDAASLGESLKARRKEKKLSQLVAADRLGISQAFYSNLERGKKSPNAGLRAKIESWLEG